MSSDAGRIQRIKDYADGLETKVEQLTAENQRLREALKDAASATNCKLFAHVHERIERALKGE